MRFKKRRFSGVARVPSITIIRKVPQETKAKKNYSCADSILTKSGKRIEVTNVPEKENRLATARCFTAVAWTPELEESMPELSDVEHRNDSPVDQLDRCGLPIGPDGRLKLDKLRCIDTDKEDEYNLGDD